MLKESVTKALEDAGLKYSDIQQAAVGYVYGIVSILFFTSMINAKS